MKYIKTNKELEFLKLKEFCEDSLAYLIDEYTIDDNKIVDVTRNMITNPTTFESEPMITSPGFIFIKNLSRIDRKFRRTVNWSDIKDDVIPFLIMLNSKYNVSLYIRMEGVFDKEKYQDRISTSFRLPREINIIDLINDELPEDIKIFYIKIEVEL
jgi:hypothetical protein